MKPIRKSARRPRKTVRRAETSTDQLRCDWCGCTHLISWDTVVFRLSLPYARHIFLCGDVGACNRVLTIDAEGAD